MRGERSEVRQSVGEETEGCGGLFGHFPGVAMVDDVLLAAGREVAEQVGVGKELMKALGEVLRVFGAVEKAALGFAEDFGEGAVVGLDDRDAGREGFENEQTLWFAVGCRDGQNIERAEEVDFAPAIDFADELGKGTHAGCL